MQLPCNTELHDLKPPHQQTKTNTAVRQKRTMRRAWRMGPYSGLALLSESNRVRFRHASAQPPERTVDAWVSAAICTVFPHARIWGPTQAISATNWDYGLSLGDGKIFILEDKGTSPVARTRRHPLLTHKIDVDRSQLDWYCDEVEPD
jgi:hypothetical protein